MKAWGFEKVWVAALLLMATIANAQPVAFDYQVINGRKIFKDAKSMNVFYYEPFGYKLATAADGAPQFTLLQMRYTGTQAAGDKGHIRYRNVLQFKMQLEDSTVSQLQAIKNALQASRPQLFLKPIPITRFQSLLVYAPANNADSTLRLLTNGFTEGGDENAVANSYWDERTFSIRLSDEDAQLLEAALKNHQAAISLSYAFFATFSAQNSSTFTATVNNSVNKQVLDYFDSSLIQPKDSLLQNVLLKADAIALNIDLERWPDAVQKVDINEKLPPAYPLFDVYCYDFNNAIRPDLYAKRIEMSAISVNGSEIYYSVTFKQSQPDIYVKSIRFPYAVRFDKPYKFRMMEITRDGEIHSTDWTEHTSWSDIIDITTKK